MTRLRRRPFRTVTLFVFVMLVIEYLDEFAYSILEVSRPLIRDSFALNYVDLSLITTVPYVVSLFVEPFVGLWFPASKRKWLMVWGCAAFGVGLLLQGFSPAFWLFIVGATLQAPASGVFVNLAQASLMDEAPDRRANNMALWTFSGSVAVVTGPLILTAALALGSGWRSAFVIVGLLSLVLAGYLVVAPSRNGQTETPEDEEEDSFRSNVKRVVELLKRWTVWRWMLLLEASDLMLDVLFGLMALYMVDVVGVTQAQAGLTIAVWTGVGLLGDFLLIPLLERVRGLTYLRLSAFMILWLYPLFLLADQFWVKLILIGIIGLFNAGWFAILQGKLYDTLGKHSGSILVIGNVTGVFSAFLPLILGALAEAFGLNMVVWLLWSSPMLLLVGLWGAPSAPIKGVQQ